MGTEDLAIEFQETNMPPDYIKDFIVKCCSPDASKRPNTLHALCILGMSETLTGYTTSSDTNSFLKTYQSG